MRLVDVCKAKKIAKLNRILERQCHCGVNRGFAFPGRPTWRPPESSTRRESKTLSSSESTQCSLFTCILSLSDCLLACLFIILPFLHVSALRTSSIYPPAPALQLPTCSPVRGSAFPMQTLIFSCLFTVRSPFVFACCLSSIQTIATATTERELL
jgi:hypothetical protein